MANTEISKDDVYTVIGDVLERFFKLVVSDLNNRNISKSDKQVNDALQYMCDVALNPRKFLSCKNAGATIDGVKKVSDIVCVRVQKCFFEQELAAQYKKFCELIIEWDFYGQHGSETEQASVKQKAILEFACAFLGANDNFVLLFAKKKRKSK